MVHCLSLSAYSETLFLLGSGCGSVCRAVDSNTRSPRFENFYIEHLFTVNCIEKRKIKNYSLCPLSGYIFPFICCMILFLISTSIDFIFYLSIDWYIKVGR